MAFEDEAAHGAAPGGGAPMAPGRKRKTYVRYTAKLGREICERVAAGEQVQVICAEPWMPLATTVCDWAREHPDFGDRYHRAKALSAREGLGRNSTYCEVVAHEICVRAAEGESLSSIARDPAMPSLSSMMHWQKRSPEFAEALAIARQARAEGLADLGWQMALAATPETAYLTRVQLSQLRWTASITSPKTHGRMKPAEPPAPPEVEVVVFRHFSVEQNLETGEIRQVTFTPDPDGTLPVRTWVGPWMPALDPKAGTRNIKHELYPAPPL
jgi:hypothetical protein